jgi:hypothetical protein
MVIKSGTQRGEIDSSGHLKVLLFNEGIFIKVIAISNNRKKVIGTLANNSFEYPSYKWGTLVLAVERNSEQLAKITKKINAIPNTPEWSYIKTNFGGVFG